MPTRRFPVYDRLLPGVLFDNSAATRLRRPPCNATLPALIVASARRADV